MCLSFPKRKSCTARNISERQYEKLSERGRSPLRIEGRSANSWLLVDYGDVIVNVFDRESRSFYDLDRLFPETARRDIDAMICEVDKKFELETKI